MPSEEFMQRFEREMRESRERTRAVVASTGRLDVLAEFDADMRNLDLGITGARSAWHSISPKQREVLVALSDHGGALERRARGLIVYQVRRGSTVLVEARLGTARALSARNLIHVDGGAADPEARFVVTEHGRFVRKHGGT